MKLRNKILIYTLPLILFPMILLALANYYFVEMASNIQKEEADNRKINEAVFNIQRNIQDAKDDVKFIAETAAITDYLQAVATVSSVESSLKENATNSLQNFFGRNPYYVEFLLFSKDGKRLLNLSKLRKKKPQVNSKEKEIFNKSISQFSDGVSQLPLEKLDKNNVVIPFSLNIVKGKFVGIVILKMSSGAFERPLKSLSNSGLCSFLFEDKGNVFVGQKLSVCQKKAISKRRLNEVVTEITGLDSASSKKFEFTSDLDNSGFSVIPVYFTAEGLSSAVTNKEKWFLGVSKLEWQKSPLNTFSVLFFSVLAIAIGLIYFAANIFAKKLTNPIEKVSYATTQIARGESIPNLNIKSGDEIEDLAAAIQQMNLDLKSFQKQIVQSAKLATMGEMTARISHEIQNRVSGISLWVQYLDSELNENDEMQKYLNEMKQGLNGFTDLLANLKSYYRTPDLDLRKVDLNLLIENSLTYVREKTDEKDVLINLRLANSLPSFWGDEDKLKSVIINLLINALESLEQKGKIDIETKLFTEDQILLTIMDNGCGISTKDLSQIFYPFYSTKSSGSGLGLAITSNIISAHQGKIEVESEVGKGTSFKVLLSANNTNLHE